jgi:hypothetical protein
MERFVKSEVDHLFTALILHTKTTRAEQAKWLKERAEIWRKILASSDCEQSEQSIYRTQLFESPEQLRVFWKTPEAIEKTFLNLTEQENHSK